MEQEWKRTQMPGHVIKCPDCGKKTFAWSDQLSESLATPGRLVIIKGLTGHRCSSCGARALDMASALDVEKAAMAETPADYEVAVTRQRDRRAVFFPKDILRRTIAGEAKTAFITPIDDVSLLVRLVRTKAEGPSRPGSKKQAQS